MGRENQRHGSSAMGIPAPWVEVINAGIDT